MPVPTSRPVKPATGVSERPRSSVSRVGLTRPSARLSAPRLVNNVYLVDGDDGMSLNYTTEAITSYGGPYPAEGSGAHRYTILLLPQPESFQAPAELATPGVRCRSTQLPLKVSTPRGLTHVARSFSRSPSRFRTSPTTSRRPAFSRPSLAGTCRLSRVPRPPRPRRPRPSSRRPFPPSAPRRASLCRSPHHLNLS